MHEVVLFVLNLKLDHILQTVVQICFSYTLSMDYGYNFPLVLKNLPYSFLMIVKYPMIHFSILQLMDV